MLHLSWDDIHTIGDTAYGLRDVVLLQEQQVHGKGRRPFNKGNR